MSAAERAYERAVAHYRTCAICAQAGGELAEVENLCPIGSMLAEQWERAETLEAPAPKLRAEDLPSRPRKRSKLS